MLENIISAGQIMALIDPSKKHVRPRLRNKEIISAI